MGPSVISQMASGLYCLLLGYLTYINPGSEGALYRLRNGADTKVSSFHIIERMGMETLPGSSTDALPLDTTGMSERREEYKNTVPSLWPAKIKISSSTVELEDEVDKEEAEADTQSPFSAALLAAVDTLIEVETSSMDSDGSFSNVFMYIPVRPPTGTACTHFTCIERYQRYIANNHVG